MLVRQVLARRTRTASQEILSALSTPRRDFPSPAQPSSASVARTQPRPNPAPVVSPAILRPPRAVQQRTPPVSDDEDGDRPVPVSSSRSEKPTPATPVSLSVPVAMATDDDDRDRDRFSSTAEKSTPARPAPAPSANPFARKIGESPPVTLARTNSFVEAVMSKWLFLGACLCTFFSLSLLERRHSTYFIRRWWRRKEKKTRHVPSTGVCDLEEAQDRGMA
jgi:hypothetical protein